MVVTFTFMHDGAPRYRSKVVSEYLQKSKVEVFNWPENIPNLNPIENVWSYMKNIVAEKQLSSSKKLVTVIKEVWVNKISSE